MFEIGSNEAAAAKPERSALRRSARLVAGTAALVLGMAVLQTQEATPQPATAMPPPTLQETGLYSDFGTLQIDPNHIPFSPQYPLWTDGATKRRWMSLPAGTAIDASDPNAWRFPVGTRFWKEFSFDGPPIETRYLERQSNGEWLYAAYAWDSEDAQLAPERGKRGAYPLGNGRSHTIPGVSDCKVCHQGGPTDVLGFSALQLSPKRDPGALHSEPSPPPGVDLQFLVDRGLLVGLPKSLLDRPPQIESSSAAERAALGYMHGNCGHCHNEQGSLKNLGLFLRYTLGSAVAPAIDSTVGHPIRKAAPGQSADAVVRIQPRDPNRSALAQRIASRYPALQMPPLGTELVDGKAVSLLRDWIAELDELQKADHEN